MRRTHEQLKPATVILRSGDVLLFGGPARLVYHGVERVLEPRRKNLAPLGLKPGRLNLTFRMY